MANSVIKKRKARGSLSKEGILSAAQKLLHEKGLEALSIRKIANELNAGAMSIYNHFPTKQDIVSALVSDFVVRAHQQKHSKVDWEEWLYLTFKDIYQASTSEPEYLSLMINSSNIGVASVAIFEDALSCLIESGFSTQDASIAFHRLLSFTLGAAMLRNNSMPTNEGTVDASSPPDNAQPRMQAHHIMLGSGFDDSLRALISGIKR